MKKETPHQNPNILINNKTFLLKIQGGETKKKNGDPYEAENTYKVNIAMF